MKKLVSLKRRIAVLSVLAVVLAGMWVFRPATATTRRTEDLPALFTGFVGDAAATKITLKQDGSLISGGKPREVVLERRQKRGGPLVWVVASAFDYPANEENVNRLLSEIAQARLVTEATRRKDAFPQYVQDGSWVEISVRGDDDKDLATFGVGKEQDGETYVRLATPEPRVVRVRNFSAYNARPQPEAWLQTRVFPDLEARDVESIELVQRIEVDGKPTTRTITLVKEPQEAGKDGAPPPERTWSMKQPEAGAAATPDVEELARALVGMLFEDVVGRADGRGEPDYGFKEPEVVARATFKSPDPSKPDPSIELTLGKRDEAGKRWFARRGAEAWVFALEDSEYGTGRLRSDPSKFKPAPPPAPEKPADAPKDGPSGSPDGDPPTPAPAPPQPAPEPAPAPAPAPEPAPAPSPAPGEPVPPK